MKHKKIFITLVLTLALFLVCFISASAEVTDLTGTVWALKSTCSYSSSLSYSLSGYLYTNSSSSSVSFSYIYSGSTYYSAVGTVAAHTFYYIKASSTCLFGANSTTLKINSTSNSVTSPKLSSNLIYITGGSSATDSNAISWLQSVAKQVVSAPDTPTNVSFDSSTNTLSWDAVDDATSYIVEYSSSGSASDSSNTRTTVTSTSYSVTQSGYYQVYAVNSDGTSDGSGFVSYSYYIASPTVSFNSSTNKLTWLVISPATEYIVEYSSTGNASDSSNIRTTVTTSYYEIYLSGYYRVFAKNSYGTSDGSEWVYHEFTPLTPSNVYVDSSGVLRWDSVLGASNYTITVSTNGSTVFVSFNTGGTSYPLPDNGYFRVTANASNGNSSSPSAWVQYGSLAPTQVNDLVYSASGLSWTSSTSYTYYIYSSKSSDFSSQSVTEFTSTTLSGIISYSPVYPNNYYRVSAYNSSGVATVSNTVYVTLDATQLATPSAIIDNSNTSRCTISWSSISHADSYNVYLDNKLVANTSSTSYTTYQSGTLYVQALSSSSSYISSALSEGVVATITTEWGSSDEPSQPDSATDDDDNTSLLKKLVDWFEFFFDTLVSAIVKLFGSAVEGISSLFAYVSQFVEAFGDIYTFLPLELRTLVTSAFSIFLLLAVFRLFK